MKTQLSKPARSKARYTEEYKKEALELWRASGRSAAKVAAGSLTKSNAFATYKYAELGVIRRRRHYRSIFGAAEGDVIGFCERHRKSFC